MNIQPVELEKSYRLLNHGPTVMISAKHDGVENVMSAAWVCALDFNKLTAVIGSQAYTRKMIEKSGYFAVQIPVVAQMENVLYVGERSYADNPDKNRVVEFFYQDGFDLPLVKGCAGWLVCRLIPNAENQQNHDLFMGEIIAAWGDTRVFKDGHWHFDDAPDELRTVHYVAGGQFYSIGRGTKFDHGPDMD